VDAVEGVAMSPNELISKNGAAASRTTIRVNLSEKVDLDKITAIIGTIGGRYGCRTCGLLGFDLNLAGDPGDFSEIKSLPGVNSVEVE
jgi:hypothetical protein